MKIVKHLATAFLFLSTLPTLANPIDAELKKATDLIETDPASAISLCQKIHTQKISKKQLCLVYHTLGNAYAAQGQNAEARQMFKQTIRKAKEIKDTITWASALSDLGVVFRISEFPDSAILCYNQTLALLEQTYAPVEESYLLTSIAVFYTNQGRFDEGIKYGRRAFAMAKKSQDNDAIMYAGQTLGLVLYINGEKKEGLAIEEEMVEIAEKSKQPRYILKAYAAIIEMYHKEGHQKAVKQYIAKGKQLLKQVPESSVESIGFLESCFLVLTNEGHYRESLDIQHQIINMRGAGTFIPFNKLYQFIARNYQKLGDIKKMGQAYERSIAITDSLNTLEIDQQLSELDVKYETAQRELQITSLKTTKIQQQMAMVTIGLTALLLIACLCAFFLIKKTRMRKALEMKALHDQLEAIDKERGRLAAELHDGVCSDLTGISLLMQTPQANLQELSQLIATVRNDVRTVSHALMPPRIEGLTLHQLLLDLQIKSNNRISIGRIDEQKLTPTDVFQLYRITQEWTSNILKHSDATLIHISLKDNMLLITDNGAPAQLQKAKGIGLENIHNRALSIGANASYAYENEQNCLKVTQQKP